MKYLTMLQETLIKIEGKTRKVGDKNHRLYVPSLNLSSSRRETDCNNLEIFQEKFSFGTSYLIFLKLFKFEE